MKLCSYYSDNCQDGAHFFVAVSSKLSAVSVWGMNTQQCKPGFGYTKSESHLPSYAYAELGVHG